MSGLEDIRRCLSSCEVVPGVLKRCVRAAFHTEGRHLWLEAEGAVPPRILAEWDDQRHLRVSTVRPARRVEEVPAPALNDPDGGRRGD